VAKNKITDLRDHLFETLEALKDPDKPMELDRAKAISQVAQTIIDSAKVEVELVKALNARDLASVRPGSSFFAVEDAERPKMLTSASGGSGR
jgi:hypothetical protein